MKIIIGLFFYSLKLYHQIIFLTLEVVGAKILNFKIIVNDTWPLMDMGRLKGNYGNEIYYGVGNSWWQS